MSGSQDGSESENESKGQVSLRKRKQRVYENIDSTEHKTTPQKRRLKSASKKSDFKEGDIRRL